MAEQMEIFWTAGLQHVVTTRKEGLGGVPRPAYIPAEQTTDADAKQTTASTPKGTQDQQQDKYGRNHAEERRCYNCKERGHIAARCPSDSSIPRGRIVVDRVVVVWKVVVRGMVGRVVEVWRVVDRIVEVWRVVDRVV